MKEHVLRLCAQGKIAIDLRGMEFLQTQPGENEDAAWKRMCPKMPFGGRQLDEVVLSKPSAVTMTGGSVLSETRTCDPVVYTGFDNGYAPRGSVVVTALIPPPRPFGTPGISDGDMFFDGVLSARPRVLLANPATSPLNLIGKLEIWGIGSTTQVVDLTLKVVSLNGMQLKDLLKKLPDGMTFEICLEKEGS